MSTLEARRAAKESLLQVDGVTKGFAADAPLALAETSFTVAAHEIVALVGTSGCGKSTLLRMIAGLDAPSAGEIRLGGHRVAGPDPEIGMVFQEPRLMPWLTVRENLRLALPGQGRQAQDERIAATLRQVGLADFGEALPRALSGGMAQRVAIARALVRSPRLLLLDEPFSALDSFTRAKLQRHLLELWQEANFTMVLVTHDLEEALALADRGLILRGQPGRLYGQLPVDLPHPRRRSSPVFQELKEELARALDLEAD